MRMIDPLYISMCHSVFIFYVTYIISQSTKTETLSVLTITFTIITAEFYVPSFSISSLVFHFLYRFTRGSIYTPLHSLNFILHIVHSGLLVLNNSVLVLNKSILVVEKSILLLYFCQ